MVGSINAANKRVSVHGVMLKLIVSGAMSIGLSIGPAQAQIQPPPRHDATTGTGVSYRGGGFSIQEEDLSIGDPGTGLRMDRSYSSTVSSVSDPFLAAVGWTQTFNVYVVSQPLPQHPDGTPSPNYRGQCVYTVTGGSGSEGFVYAGKINPLQTGCGGAKAGTYIPITPGGAKLEYLTSTTPNFYRYTGADGTVINFVGGTGRAANWTRPDGTRLDFTYVSGSLKSVFSNRGWAILYESPNKICAVNTAQTYIIPTSTCPAGAQTVTYSYSPGTYVTTWNLLTGATKDGRTRTYQYANNDHVNCIKDPGQTVCRIQNTYGHCPEDPLLPSQVQPQVRQHDPVISQQDGSGRSYTYSYSVQNFGLTAANLCPQWSSNTDPDYRPFNPMTTTVAASGIAGSITAVTDTASQLVSLTDSLGHSTQFAYDGSINYDYETGDPNGVILPENNSESYTKDDRGNITAKIVTPKPGSGLLALTISADYPATCTNIFTCNKPTSVTDAKGNTTNFTYDPAHGGVLTETSPADANGVRPVKRFAYVQRTAWLKNSAGGFTASAYPVWLLGEMRTCQTSATVGNGCTAGANDEVVTTYDYGPNSGPNNLQVRGIVLSAGGINLRTCYAYDINGRKISETSANANLTSCS